MLRKNVQRQPVSARYLSFVVVASVLCVCLKQIPAVLGITYSQRQGRGAKGGSLAEWLAMATHERVHVDKSAPVIIN